MPNIHIRVNRKRAISPQERLVCGNTDYSIVFTFDTEWDAYDVKTARFIYDGQIVDVVFSGDTCPVPKITNATHCMVGVFAGDLRTTTPALIPCDKSILCSGGSPAEPAPDVYAQIMELLNCGEVADYTPTDPKFFDIDFDGIVSLKPEYRGHPADATDPYSVSDNGVGKDGSRINELPETIVFPEIINGTVVSGFQPGMFQFNFRVEEIVFPDPAYVIPDKFCNDAKYLRSIKNTEHITKVGARAFRNTRIEKALFPNLKELGERPFAQAALLKVVDIGNEITEIPLWSFGKCNSLFVVRGGESIKKVGANGFYSTTSLRNLPFLGRLTSIGNSAFLQSRIQYSWSSLAGCTFGTSATPIQQGEVDYWSGVTFTARENPLNTVMNQRNPAWANDTIGNLGKKWSGGCDWLTLLHIHSALSGKTYNHPNEFANELTALGVLKSATADTVKAAAKALGYEATTLKDLAGDYSSNITQEVYQTVCAKLAAGAYVYLPISIENNANAGHVVALYGVNEIGEMLVLDSDTGHSAVDLYDEGHAYSIPFQNIAGPSSDFVIIEKTAS